MDTEKRDFPWATFLHNVEALAGESGGLEQFCARVGISFWTLNAWRANRMVQPSALSLDAIADEYNLTIDDLISKRLPKSR